MFRLNFREPITLSIFMEIMLVHGLRVGVTEVGEILCFGRSPPSLSRPESPGRGCRGRPMSPRGQDSDGLTVFFCPPSLSLR